MRRITVAAAAFVAGAVALGALITADTEGASAQTVSNISNKLALADQASPGKWEIVCADGQSRVAGDEVGIANINHSQCHLRFVDIFQTAGSADGELAVGMIAAFVVPERNGVRVEFAVSRGLALHKDRFHLSRNGFTVWRMERDDCLSDGVCTFSGPAADDLVTAFSDANAETLKMQLDFRDQEGRQYNRQWDMMPFSEMIADFIPAKTPAMM